MKYIESDIPQEDVRDEQELTYWPSNVFVALCEKLDAQNDPKNDADICAKWSFVEQKSFQR